MRQVGQTHSKHSADGKTNMGPRVHLSAQKNYETPFYSIMNFQLGGTAKFSALAKDLAKATATALTEIHIIRYQ